MTRNAVPSSSRGEWAVAPAMVLTMAVALLLGGGLPLVTQRAWLDEYHTLFLAGRGSLPESIRNLAQGADFNPPGLHLLVRALGWVLGGVDTSGLHVLGLRVAFGTLMVLAMVGVYRLLRRRFDRLSAFGGAFAVWAHPLLVQNTFELRFYGPWVLAAVLFTTALSDEHIRSTTARTLAISASSIFLCLSHYFAILSWALVALPFVVAMRRQPRRRVVADLAGILAGPVALAACLPILLGQRAALSVQTWIEPRSPATVLLFLLLTPGWPLLVALGLRLLPRRPPPAPAERDGPAGSAPDVALVALVLQGAIPIILIVFSILVQPAIIDRYATVSILFCAPALASSLSRLQPSARVAVVAAFVAVGSLSARVAVSRERGIGQSLERSLKILRDSVDPGMLVVVCTRRDLYPLAHARPSPTQDLVYPILPDSIAAAQRPIVGHERDVARVQARLFGFPAIRRVEELRLLSTFVVIDAEHAKCAQPPWFPEHVATRIADQAFMLRRRLPS